MNASATMTTSDQQTKAEQALVVGLGQTGFACVRHLASRGVVVSVADTREKPPMRSDLNSVYPNVELRTGGFDPNWFKQFQLIVVSPGVSLQEPALVAAKMAGAEVVGDVELFLREAPAPIVGITGSNGKTTVTSLVNAILQAVNLDVVMGGNIGVPVLDLRREPQPACYVLELSSFQLEGVTSINPAAATVLNISMDHMDRYTSMRDYAAAKARIFGPDTRCVVNRDDPNAVELVCANVAEEDRCVSFGEGLPPRDNDYGLEDDGRRVWIRRGSTRLLSDDSVKLSGTHNLLNIMAAMALSEVMGVDPHDMLEPVRKFSGLPHRMELVADIKGVKWINDSKGTNVGATVAALGGLNRPVVLIAGGLGKGADFSPLGEAAAKRAKAVVVLGEDAERVAAALPTELRTIRVESLESAVRQAQDIAQPGDVVLLSPACASFDMFVSYEARGDQYRALVQELAA